MAHFFDVLIDRIAAAEKTVHFETFLWKEGVLGNRVAAALAESARAGKQEECCSMDKAHATSGKAADAAHESTPAAAFSISIKVLANIGVLNDRDHRMLVVIDGHEASRR